MTSIKDIQNKLLPGLLFKDLEEFMQDNNCYLVPSPFYNDNTKTNCYINIYNGKWTFNCLRSDTRGDMIDLYCKLHKANKKYFIENFDNYKIKQILLKSILTKSANLPKGKYKNIKKSEEVESFSTSRIEDEKLLDYLSKRGIKKIPYLLKQIKIVGQPYVYLGFKNEVGGYALRNEKIKRNLGKQFISIEEVAMKKLHNKLVIIEGFFDYLSFYQIESHLNDYSVSYIVLNSTNNYKKLNEIPKETWDDFDDILIALDNDESGEETAEKIKEFFEEKEVKNYRKITPKFGDWNDDLVGGFLTKKYLLN